MAGGYFSSSIGTPSPGLNRKVLAACALLFLFTLLLYARALKNGFVNYDDPGYVTRNSQVQQGLALRSVYWAFTTLPRPTGIH